MNSKTIKSKAEIIKLLKLHENEIIERFQVRKIGLFGSYVREQHDKKSDIDILVQFKPAGVTFDNYMNLKFYLEELFAVKVDLILKDSIKKALKPYILKEVVYV